MNPPSCLIQTDTLICSMPLEAYARKVEEFHGNLAPGLLIGGFMVDLAYKHLPSGGLFDAVSESEGCLPDAIQLLTPCSIGNGWLKIANTGRFALTLFDKYTGAGIRVSMNADALEAWTEIKRWFYKLVRKCEQDQDRLIGEIVAAGPEILRVETVQVDPGITRKTKGQRILICPECKEPYPEKFGEKCGYCSGKAVYFSRPALGH